MYRSPKASPVKREIQVDSDSGTDAIDDGPRSPAKRHRHRQTALPRSSLSQSNDGSSLLLKDLRPANLDFVEKVITRKRPTSMTSRTVVIPIIKEHIKYDLLPDPTRDASRPPIPMYSYLYSISPMIKNFENISTLIRDCLVTNQKWKKEDLPHVRCYARTHQDSDSLTSEVLVQCKGADSHLKWKNTIEMTELDDKKEGIKYKLQLLDSGSRAGIEIVSADFLLMDEGVGPIRPVEHIVACRVAWQFAKSCQASLSEDYPRAADGLLGCWREQLEEVWTDGQVIVSDLNVWSLALHVNEEVDRATFPAHIIDGITGLKFQFVHPGSAEYCKLHADSTKHRGEPCDLQVDLTWNRNLVHMYAGNLCSLLQQPS